MERSPLKLVVPLPAATAARRRSLGAAALGALLLLAALAATLRGADRHRRPVHLTDVAQQTLTRIFEGGTADPEVRAGLVSLRRRLGRSPLDSRARAVYAGLLLEAAQSAKDTEAAAFHASKAAEFAPVTAPVNRVAAELLIRCNRKEEALAITRSMFAYDAERAAEVLASMELFLGPGEITPAAAGRALPESADAWLAWSRRLLRLGRSEEAEAWFRAGNERWPDHDETVRALVTLGLQRRDWALLGRLLPADEPLPSEERFALLHAARALLNAREGRAEAARRDAGRAVGLAGEAAPVLARAGDAYLALGDVETARSTWNRALFAVAGREDRRAIHASVLVRLARLEEAHGEPAAALRAWREVLVIDPEHAEASRRVDEMTGVRR